MLDWSDGNYELTAKALEPAARELVAAADITASARVLDLGCGTGNAAIEAAQLGATVVAVDPAARLLDVLRERAHTAHLVIETHLADAARLPVDGASFDIVLSAFALIFAPDADAALAEIIRVLKPSGRLVLTSWVPEGAVAEWSAVVGAKLGELAPTPESTQPRPAWGDPVYVEELLARHGLRPSIERRTITFDGDSPSDWFDEQARHHPAVRSLHRQLAHMPEEWEKLRVRCIELLRAGNEDLSGGLRLSSPYLLIRGERTGASGH